MNKAELVAKIEALSLPFGEYIIVGSASMAVRGIREANDLDIVAQPTLFAKLAKTWPLDEEFFKKWNRKKLRGDEVEVYDGLYLDNDKYSISNSELIKRADIIEGLPFQPLENLLLCKLDIGRSKDMEDIELIRRHLNT